VKHHLGACSVSETPASRINGDEIISELIHNAQVGQFRLRYTILLPCRFNVYLQQSDYELIAPVADVVRREAKQALSEHLENLNKVRRSPKLVERLGIGKPGDAPKYKIQEPDWSVDFHQAEDDRLRPGEIEIYSDLGTAQALDLGSGAKTTFITRRSEGQATERSEKTQATSRAPVLATLRYTDQGGEKVFAMTKEEIVVGRGGKAVWVDLKVDGLPDISREHCRIRRDAASGSFFLKDLSQFGTAMNGTTVPPSIDRSGGGGVDRNVEVPIPATANIALADVLVMHFEAKQPE
jgi:hypothetical protein